MSVENIYVPLGHWLTNKSINMVNLRRKGCFERSSQAKVKVYIARDLKVNVIPK